MKKHLFFISGMSFGSHFYVSKFNHKLYAFGNNYNGGLGLGSGGIVTTPREVKGMKGRVKNIVGGHQFVLVHTKELSVWSSGWNKFGQLSLGHVHDRYKLCLVKTFGKKKVSKIAAGGSHSVFIVNNEAYASGLNSSRQLGDGTTTNKKNAVKMNVNERIVDVSCGQSCTLLINEKGELFKAGIICRRGNFTGWVSKITGFPKGSRVSKVGVGDDHLFCSTENPKQVYHLGSNNLQRDSSYYYIRQPHTEPFLIKGLNGRKVLDIKSGSSHTIILLQGGQALGYGNTSFLGSESNNFIDEYGFVRMRINVNQIECGKTESWLFLKNGEILVGGGYSSYFGPGFEKVKNISKKLVNHKILQSLLGRGKHITKFQNKMIFQAKCRKLVDLIICTTN